MARGCQIVPPKCQPVNPILQSINLDSIAIGERIPRTVPKSDFLSFDVWPSWLKVRARAILDLKLSYGENTIFPGAVTVEKGEPVIVVRRPVDEL